MKQKTILTLLVLLMSAVFAFADDRTDEQRAKDAEQIVKTLEQKNWIFIVERAETSGLSVEDLRPDDNFFASKDGEISVRLNYFGANVINNMTPHRKRMVLEEMMSDPTLRPMNFSETYRAKLRITDQKIEISKNKKSVRVALHYDLLETSADNSLPKSNLLEMDINTKDCYTTIIYSTINLQETYFGNFGKTIYVDQ